MFPAGLPACRNPGCGSREVEGSQARRKFFSPAPKAFEVSAEIESECELYGCLGTFPPQGRTLRQTS